MLQVILHSKFCIIPLIETFYKTGVEFDFTPYHFTINYLLQYSSYGLQNVFVISFTSGRIRIQVCLVL
jgi:hypothetical protein